MKIRIDLEVNNDTTFQEVVDAFNARVAEESTWKLVTVKHLQVDKRELPSIRYLQGKVVKSVKVLASKKTLVTTEDGGGLVIADGTTHPASVEEILQLGLVSKEDLEVIKRARKLGIVPCQ